MAGPTAASAASAAAASARSMSVARRIRQEWREAPTRRSHGRTRQDVRAKAAGTKSTQRADWAHATGWRGAAKRKHWPASSRRGRMDGASPCIIVRYSERVSLCRPHTSCTAANAVGNSVREAAKLAGSLCMRPTAPTAGLPRCANRCGVLSVCCASIPCAPVARRGLCKEATTRGGPAELTAVCWIAADRRLC